MAAVRGRSEADDDSQAVKSEADARLAADQQKVPSPWRGRRLSR
jgi:hypothetical protein